MSANLELKNQTCFPTPGRPRIPIGPGGPLNYL